MDKAEVRFDRSSDLWHHRRPTSAGWVFFQVRPHQRPPGSDRITTRLCVFQPQSCSLFLSSRQEANSERASHWPGSSRPSAGSTCLNRAGSGWWVWTRANTRTHPHRAYENSTFIQCNESHKLSCRKAKSGLSWHTAERGLQHVCKFTGVGVKFDGWNKTSGTKKMLSPPSSSEVNTSS